MSAKYNQHPMEAKAQEDIEIHRRERSRTEQAWHRWLEFWKQSSDREPTPAEAFRAGWVECMDAIMREAKERMKK